MDRVHKQHDLVVSLGIQQVFVSLDQRLLGFLVELAR
jgi:hypothetical protein